jgi:type I restriction enzyme, R subunit
MAQQEQEARRHNDRPLKATGWTVCDLVEATTYAGRSDAIRELLLSSGFGFADHLLYVDGKAAGVMEAKREDVTSTGANPQSDKYTKDLSDAFPCRRNPLPFLYQSTGIEKRFTNRLNPELRSQSASAFHRPAALRDSLNGISPARAYVTGGYARRLICDFTSSTFLAKVRDIPNLVERCVEGVTMCRRLSGLGHCDIYPACQA